MINKELMLYRLGNVEQLARKSRSARLLNNPFRYVYAIGLKNFLYPLFKKEKQERIKIFTGEHMYIILPSATDIYLTGGKSHDSEIRLAYFLINTLNAGDHFLDIGAHYGYFTLLANAVVGKKGKLKAVEPTTTSASVLRKNCSPFSHIEVLQKAVFEQEGEISFYEFPNLFSEYNALNDDQFKDKKWFSDFSPLKTIVAATTVNELTGSDFTPKVVKIDVEGAEQEVILGGLDFFNHHNPVIAMEYLSEEERDNTQHKKAIALLKTMNYGTFVIDQKGYLQEVTDIDAYLAQNNFKSDNIVLHK